MRNAPSQRVFRPCECGACEQCRFVAESMANPFGRYSILPSSAADLRELIERGGSGPTHNPAAYNERMTRKS